MAELLVTGGAGFIGANFAHYWLRRHPSDRVVVLDALTYAGNPVSLLGLRDDPRFVFVCGNIGDRTLVARLLREYGLGTVVNFAAESHVDRSIDAPEAFVQTNLVATEALLSAVRKVWLEERAVPGPVRFHHVSTDEVYGSLDPDVPPFSETTQFAPNSPYAASKAGSDHLVRAYYRTFGLPVTTSNCSNNYGPYQFPEKLIPLMLINALRGRPLPIYGDGGNVRDWLFVEDHCRALESVLFGGRVGQTYNIGGRNELTNNEVLQTLCTMLDAAFAGDPALAIRFPESPPARGGRSASLISFVPDRPGHDRRYAIDASKIETELGFIPVETFETGMWKTVQWYLNNESWWRRVLDGSYQHPAEMKRDHA